MFGVSRSVIRFVVLRNVIVALSHTSKCHVTGCLLNRMKEMVVNQLRGGFVRGSLVIVVPSTRPSWPSQPKLDQVRSEAKKLKSGDLQSHDDGRMSVFLGHFQIQHASATIRRRQVQNKRRCHCCKNGGAGTWHELSSLNF
jgi:hypothetical protein